MGWRSEGDVFVWIVYPMEPDIRKIDSLKYEISFPRHRAQFRLISSDLTERIRTEWSKCSKKRFGMFAKRKKLNK